MYESRGVPFLSAVVLLGAACTDPAPTDVAAGRPAFEIQDAVHNGGDGRLFFLPPLVDMPAKVGTPLADASPTTIICEWSETDGYCVQNIAVYTRTSGPGSDVIRYDAGTGGYIVDWHTNDFALKVSGTYRIHVVVDGLVLGHADVLIVNNRGGIKSQQTGDLIPLVNGGTLPIKFRLVKLPGLSAEFVNTRLATACAIDAGGNAFCWGYNADGQVGDGTAGNVRLVPTRVSGGLKFQFITASDNVCGLTTTGAPFCWGYGDGGQLGNGTTNSYAVPTAVSGGFTFAAMAEARGAACGATAVGAAYCWGYNIVGSLGTTAASDMCNAGVCSLTPIAVSGGLSFRSLTIGGASCGITVQDKLYCWGSNNVGQIGVGHTTDSYAPLPVAPGMNFSKVSSNSYHTCALTTAGQAWCWGDNGSGQVGDGTTTRRLAPVAVSGGLTFADISVGMEGFTCGVTTSGGAYCWGSNAAGQLGNGAPGGSTVPTPVAGDLVWRDVSAGWMNACGVTTSSEVYCWGFNGRGELGNGTTQDSPIPTQVVRTF